MKTDEAVHTYKLTNIRISIGSKWSFYLYLWYIRNFEVVVGHLEHCFDSITHPWQSFMVNNYIFEINTYWTL